MELLPDRGRLIHGVDAVEQQATVHHREDSEEEDRRNEHELDQPLAAVAPSPKQGPASIVTGIDPHGEIIAGWRGAGGGVGGL